MFTVYLAGPITGLTYKDGQNWRDFFPQMYFKCIEKLSINSQLYNIHFLSPLRGKEYLQNVGIIEGSYDGYDALATSKGIIARDRNDCHRADAIVFNLLGSKIVSIGTMMELAWAWDHRTPTIVIMEELNIHRHPFVDEATNFRVSCLEEAAEVLRHIIG